MLSKRLKAVASLVTTSSIIDVGCDHGYLDIYLTKKGIKCKATDISDKCLKKAKDNFQKLNLNIPTICTDGLNNVDIKDNDTIIISGMGADTIIKILSINLSNDLIISANNNLEKLRRYVCNKGYYIDKELFIMENDIPYIIIKFKRGNEEYNDFDYIIGPKVSDLNYYKYMINKYKNIVKKIPNKYNDEIIFYEQLIKKIENKIKVIMKTS